MPLFKLYFSPALLLLLLTCPLWQPSQSLPITSPRPMTDSCVSYARTLLQNITETLNQDDLFSGFDCTKQSVELNLQTNTASVCAPMKSRCSTTDKTEFDQDLCLQSIGDDLRHYYRFLTAQPDSDRLLSPTHHLRELMENCFASSLPADLTPQGAAVERQSTFDSRLSLCKVLKGFHVRTITINRVIAYMNSGEYTK